MKLPVAAGLATAAVTITLYPLFEGGTWFWSCMGAILVVTVTGTVASRLGARPWVAPAVTPVTVLIYLTLVFTPDEAWLRIIPTKDSVIRLAKLIASGYDGIQQYAAPVPDRPGIVLLTTAGVALIALLVDVFAVRLRRAALAGLPMLALFTVPAAVITDPIGWIAFVVAAFGYIGLLVADGRERLSRWGRAVVVRRSSDASRGSAPDTERLALSGKRIGVTAIALAVLVPALLPALSPIRCSASASATASAGAAATSASPTPSPSSAASSGSSATRPCSPTPAATTCRVICGSSRSTSSTGRSGRWPRCADARKTACRRGRCRPLPGCGPV